MPKPWEVDWGQQKPADPYSIPPDVGVVSQRDARERRDNASAARDEGRFTIEADRNARDIKTKAFDQTRDLREEYNKYSDIRRYGDAIPMYVSGLKSAPNGQGDLQLIYAYAKVMDPNTGVLGSDQQNVTQTQPWLVQRMQQLENQLHRTGQFDDQTRAGLRQEMHTRIVELKRGYDLQRDRYAAAAINYGFDPKMVVGPHAGEPYWGEINSYWRKEFGADAPPELTPRPVGGYDDENGLMGTVSDEAPWPSQTPKKGPPDDYRSSYAGQGMSGVNKGIANTLGAPVDLATMTMNASPMAINALANTDLPMIENPIGGSQWIKDQMGGWGIYDETKDPSKQFARRMGESVGAAAVPFMGAGNSLRSTAGGLFASAGGGAGAAAAQQVFPGNPLAEFAGEVFGSGLTGAGMVRSGQRAAQRKIESGIPTIDQLKQRAGDLYRQAEGRGVTADPMMTQQLADTARDYLRTQGRIDPKGRINETHTSIVEGMKMLDNYAGEPMNPTQMQAVRGVLSDGLMSADGTERHISKGMVDKFDDWADPQAPELAQARDISSRYLQAQKLEQARELAGSRAGQFTGSGFENALRTEYRGLDRASIKGNQRYSDDLNQSIQNVSRGTPLSNAARNIGRFAPTGPVSTGLGAGGGFLAGNAAGGPALGALAALAVGGAGRAGRSAATRMGIRNADIAELTARNGGAYEQAPLVDEETQRAIAAILASQLATASQPGGLFGSRRKKNRK